MKLYCGKCHRTMDEKEFYQSYDLKRFPAGRVDLCKKCFTMHVDPFDPLTFTPLLEQIDVPYVESQWVKVLEKDLEAPPLAIFGSYLSVMRLNQWKDKRYADSGAIKQEEDNARRSAMRSMGMAPDVIEANIARSTFPPRPGESYAAEDADTFSSSLVVAEGDDLSANLTKEDKAYLRVKWGSAYSPEEWIQLEQLYEDMVASYDIQGAGHFDTLKLICKTSLKANQLIDMGDVEGYRKMSAVYDQLMKSGNFQAAQNKATNGEYIDSLSELVLLCEKQGFIPRYHPDGPQDKIDRVLEDLQHYTRTLVTEETNLGALIESNISQVARQMEDERTVSLDDEEEDADSAYEESLFNFEADSILSNSDYEDYYARQEQNAELDRFAR